MSANTAIYYDDIYAATGKDYRAEAILSMLSFNSTKNHRATACSMSGVERGSMRIC